MYSKGIEALPNELLVHILVYFPTRALLPLASISHSFHDLVLHILHNRLLAAATLKDQKLSLECFHPSARLTAPALACKYIGTDSLNDKVEGREKVNEEMERMGKLGKLAGLYSHFLPLSPGEGRRSRRRRHPARDFFSHPDNSTVYPNTAVRDFDQVPSQIVNLESHELFSQLCTIVNLFRVVPHFGFSLNCVTIGEGVIRVWRDWLGAHAVLSDGKRNISPRERIPQSNSSKPTAKDIWTRVLWLDTAENVGIRVRVIEREDLGAPILSRVDEDVHVAYSIEYEELIIRTTKLLLKVEESLLEENYGSAKAIIRIL